MNLHRGPIHLINMVPSITLWIFYIFLYITFRNLEFPKCIKTGNLSITIISLSCYILYLFVAFIKYIDSLYRLSLYFLLYLNFLFTAVVNVHVQGSRMTKIVDWVVLDVHRKGLSTALTPLFANLASHLYGCVEKLMIANKVGRLWCLAILVKFKVVIAFFLVRTNILVKVVVRPERRVPRICFVSFVSSFYEVRTVVRSNEYH